MPAAGNKERREDIPLPSFSFQQTARSVLKNENDAVL